MTFIGLLLKTAIMSFVLCVWLSSDMANAQGGDPQKKEIDNQKTISAEFSDNTNYEGGRKNSLLLNGEWDYAVGDGTEKAETPSGQDALKWQKVSLPGPFMAWDNPLAKTLKSAKYVWVKRKFSLTKEQSAGITVLRWNQINYGAAVYINGKKAGENEPTGPYQTIIPVGIIVEGENEIVLKVTGPASTRRSASKKILFFPAGFQTRNFGGMPMVADDVWIDFAREAYMKWVLAMPDLTNSKVKFRITPVSTKNVDNIQIRVQVKSWPDGVLIGEGQGKAAAAPAADPLSGSHFFAEVPVPGFKAWTPENSGNLYVVYVMLEKGGKVLDECIIRFGMREIKVVDGNYKLNGRNLRLRGSTLVNDWGGSPYSRTREQIINYLYTEAREMSMNCFRTHTCPLPRTWADVCDEYGTMILLESRVTINGGGDASYYALTAPELETWHRNVLLDMAGWMGRLWNHPSVFQWVLSNESGFDNAWEEGEYHDFVVGLDPTRPTMRAGGGTKESIDGHHCGSTHSDGDAIQRVMGHSTPDYCKNVRRGRTIGNSEFSNAEFMPKGRWPGRENDPLADNLNYAQLGMEHAEAMRRIGYNLILPYQYMGWTKSRWKGAEWKAGFAKPASAAWHSALSPVLASLEVFNPDYLSGQKVKSSLHVINDSWNDAKIHVDLFLTKECPEFIPEAGCFNNPLAVSSYDFTITADTVTVVPVEWQLPVQEGSYWLTARTMGMAGRPVLSQRFVRAINPPQITNKLRGRAFVILGRDPRTDEYFTSKGLATTADWKSLDPNKNMVVVWNHKNLTPQEKQSTQALCDFAAAGGRVVVLSTATWNWPELCDVTVPPANSTTRAFVYSGVTHPVLSGVNSPEWFMRWNNLPGTVAVSSIEGTAMAGANNIMFFCIDKSNTQKKTIIAEIPAKSGGGKILFSQLNIQSRVTSSNPNYDPVADRMLVNILGW